jgi:two-component system, chemotaxis family, CheB/CheR fusion protein
MTEARRRRNQAPDRERQALDHTVIAQLQQRITDLEAANCDLASMLAGTEIAGMVLDGQLRLRRITPAAAAPFRVTDGDIGRHLGELAPGFDDPHLLADAQAVLDRAAPRVREVQGGGRWFLRRALPCRPSDHAVDRVVVTFSEMTSLKAAAHQAAARESRQTAVAQLCHVALAHRDLQALLDKAVEAVRDTLQTELVCVLELRPDGRKLRLCAGVGWRGGVVGNTLVDARPNTQTSWTLRSPEPVIVDDLRRQKRFLGPALLRQHGVVSGISVIIGSVDAPWGVVGAYAARKVRFGAGDVAFVRSVAEVLAAAIGRQRAEQAMRDDGQRLRLALEVASVGTWVWNPTSDRIAWDARQAEIFGLDPEQPPSLGRDFFAHVHPDDLPELCAALHAALHGAGSYQAEFRAVRADGATRWLTSHGAVIHAAGDGAPLLLGANLDVTARRQAEEALRTSEERFRLAMHSVAGPIYDWDIQTDRTYRSDGLERLIGIRPEATDGTWRWLKDRMHPDDLAALMPRLDAMLQGDTTSYAFEYRLRHADGHWVHVWDRGCIQRDASGKAVRAVGSSSDISELKGNEARQSLLMAELDHRVRNILASVTAITRQSRAEGRSIDDFVRTLSGRIEAMGRAHSLLSQSRWEGASLQALLDQELARYRQAKANPVRINGEDVILRPKAAQSLALALHELTANAGRYGALSTKRGRVDIAWRLTAADEVEAALLLEWRERGGPKLTTPSSDGFGTLVLRRMLAHDLGATVDLEYAPGGLVCRIALPARHIVGVNVAGDRARPGLIAPAGLSGAVLMVEDSAPVAAEIAGLIEELGCRVVGPAASLDEAERFMAEHELDAAVLDINLNGVKVYPLADQLRARRVPFIFITGYEPAYALHERFGDVPCLAKPVQRFAVSSALAQILPQHDSRRPERPAVA